MAEQFPTFDDFDEFGDTPEEPVAGPEPPKFSKTKLTSQKLAELHFQVLEELGGAGYILAQARRDPKSFMSRLGTLLPKNVDISGSSEVTIVIGDRKPDSGVGVLDHTSDAAITALSDSAITALSDTVSSVIDEETEGSFH